MVSQRVCSDVRDLEWDWVRCRTFCCEPWLQMKQAVWPVKQLLWVSRVSSLVLWVSAVHQSTPSSINEFPGYVVTIECYRCPCRDGGGQGCVPCGRCSKVMVFSSCFHCSFCWFLLVETACDSFHPYPTSSSPFPSLFFLYQPASGTWLL